MRIVGRYPNIPRIEGQPLAGSSFFASKHGEISRHRLSDTGQVRPNTRNDSNSVGPAELFVWWQRTVWVHFLPKSRVWLRFTFHLHVHLGSSSSVHSNEQLEKEQVSLQWTSWQSWRSINSSHCDLVPTRRSMESRHVFFQRLGPKKDWLTVSDPIVGGSYPPGALLLWRLV